MPNQVVVTGMGSINPLGLDVSETWSRVIEGVSGVRPITLFDSADLNVHIAAEVKDFNPAEHMDPKQVRRTDRFQQFAILAADEALKHAGLDGQGFDPDRTAAIVSSAVGGLSSIYDAAATLINSGPRRISAFTIPKIMANGAAGLLAIERGIRGPCFSIASACAAGADAIGQAWLLIRAGVVDIALAGASEATINRLGLSTFDRVGALSRRNDVYDRTPSPFDKDRDGLVMGEGAAIIVLEALDHAQARQAEVLAEMVGYASTAVAFHITAPAEDGAGGAQAIRGALRSAGLNPEDVDYINAHGTGTLLNDISETRAIKSALGEHAYKVPISSTKSMTGHMMGATGALEAIFCVQAIREGIIPPTMHLRTPDSECDLDYVPNESRQCEVRVAISNAFGFGGHNAVLAFKAFSG
jgi:beta-ketoacyl-acyl-carrier-protein synthase II